MTDKQIIIDGVDVSGCVHYKNNGKCRIPHYQQGIKYTCCNCNEWDCYYKQLKRKEQECEKLKKGYAKLTDIVAPYMNDFTGYNEELGGFDIVLCVKQLMEQLDQLKAENEELRNKLSESLMFRFTSQDNEIDKLKATLPEIKEIAEEAGNTQYLTFPDFDLKQNAKMLMGQFNGYLQQILQKINEVEDEHRI